MNYSDILNLKNKNRSYLYESQHNKNYLDHTEMKLKFGFLYLEVS